MDIKFSLALLLFFSIQGHSQISFEEKVVIDNRNATNNATSVYAADIDGDGYMDIVSASADDHKVAWYKNLNGQGFGDQQLISSETRVANAVLAIDVDGDGDIDVVAASSFDHKIVWFENLDGKGTFSSPKLITDDVYGVRSIFAADIDGDGDLDILSASYDDNKIAWYENTDGAGTFGPQHIISISAMRVWEVFAVDIDGDGNIDVISVSPTDKKLAWYKNLDGLGNFGSAQIIGNSQSFWDVFAADLDGDGDNDIVFVSGVNERNISWFENLDGQGNFGAEKNIILDSNSGSIVYAFDIDGDGDLDIVTSVYSPDGSAIEWFENLDGNGNFGPLRKVHTITLMAQSIFAADIDNDGDLDLISASLDRIGYHENLDGQGNFGKHQYVTQNVMAPVSLSVGDLDGDGKLDVVSASDDDGEIAWYRNLDGRGDFGIQNTLSVTPGANAVVVKDMDGDGDLDIVFVSWNSVLWLENLDGQGNFSEKKNISENILLSRFSDVAVGDIDGDGDMDVVALDSANAKIYWFENLDGKGNFGPENIFPDPNRVLGFPNTLWLADINNDGHLDVLSASLKNGQANWHANLDGLGTFGEPQLITSSFNNNIDFIQAADLNGDNNLDVIITKRISREIVWFENLDGLGTFGPENIVSSQVDGAIAVYAVDLDNDGDLDIVSASMVDNKISWYENLDGLGNFGPRQLIANNAGRARFITAADIDADGDMDIIAALAGDNEILWYKNSLILGTIQIDELSFSVYPNPTPTHLNISSKKAVEKWEVYNDLGQLLFDNSDTSQNNISKVDVSKLSSGVYFIKIKTEDGEIGVRKFIKI